MRCATFVALMSAAVFTFCAPARVNSDTISGTVNFEQLFLDAFTPGTGDGISIDSDDTVFGPTSNSAVTAVDLDGDGTDDINVSMSYMIHRGSDATSDARIGFRANTANTQITFFSDSGTVNDFDYGFVELNWSVSEIVPGAATIDFLADMTGSSLNGNTELYEFGIVDTSGAISAAEIAAYDATTYDGADDFVGSAFDNTLGGADDIMLEELLGARAGVTYDTDVTAYTSDAGDDIIGGGGNDLGTISGTGISQLTLYYGGFDVMNGTSAGSSNVGNPTASMNWEGTVQLSTIPEPASGSLLFIMLGGLAIQRRRN